jgi:HlyD family secretion protein
VGRRALWLVGVTAAVAAAAFYWQSGRSVEAPAISTAAVTRGDIVDIVDATGTLQAVTTVLVGTQVSGTIRALHADFNTRVRHGQVVAELEPSLFEAQVEQAQASLARLEADAQGAAVQRDDARQKLRRASELSKRELLAPTDLETAESNARAAEAAVKGAEAQILQARASLHQAEVNLGHTIITAPIDGIVISRNVDVGQTVAASMQAPTLFVIAKDLSAMQVNAAVAESDIGRIRTAQAVTFRVDAYPTVTFSGTVSQVRLQPVIEQNVVSYVTVIAVPNPDLKLKPGMTANVSVEVARATGVLRVPNGALRVRPSAEVLARLGKPAQEPRPDDRGEDGPEPAVAGGLGLNAGVWVLIDTRLMPVPIRTGITDGTRTAVLGGALTEGMAVVTSIGGTAAGAPPATTSPLLPARGRGAGGRPGGGRPTP